MADARLDSGFQIRKGVSASAVAFTPSSPLLCSSEGTRHTVVPVMALALGPMEDLGWRTAVGPIQAPHLPAPFPVSSRASFPAMAVVPTVTMRTRRVETSCLGEVLWGKEVEQTSGSVREGGSQRSSWTISS